MPDCQRLPSVLRERERERAREREGGRGSGRGRERERESHRKMIPWQAPAASEQQKTVEDGEEADEEDGEADTRGGTSVIMPSNAQPCPACLAMFVSGGCI